MVKRDWRKFFERPESNNSEDNFCDNGRALSLIFYPAVNKDTSTRLAYHLVPSAHLLISSPNNKHGLRLININIRNIQKHTLVRFFCSSFIFSSV